MQTPHGAPESEGGWQLPGELIQNLEYNHLSNLSDTRTGLKGPWLTAVRSERISRERTLEQMRQHEPRLFDMPPYEGPEEYLAQARKVNFRPPLLSSNMKSELATARNMANSYLEIPEVNARIRASIAYAVSTADLGNFLGVNLYGIIGTARAAALGSFESVRSATIRRHFPGIRLRSNTHMRWSIKDMPITASQIEAARQEVVALPPTRAPYPDFFQLPESQKLEILQAIAGEWEELCSIVHEADPKLLAMPTTHSIRSLTIMSVSTLKDAIHSNPHISPAKISWAFLRTPHEFHERVAKLKTRAVIEAQLDAIAAQRTMEKNAVSVSPAAEMPELTAGTLAEQSAEVVEFIEYDHALIVVGDRTFYLPTDQPKSLLAARVLRALGQVGNEPYIDGPAFAKMIWSEMPPTERQLFTSREKDLGRKSGVINADVYDILRKLTNLMGITRETSGERFRIETRPTTSLATAPPAETLTGLIPIFPPHTSREKIAEFIGDIIPEESMTTAAEVLQDYAFGSVPLSQSESLGLLDFIMARNGKRALRAQLEAEGSTSSIESVLHGLHEKISKILGNAYTGAYQNRVIAGNHATGQHKIKHISGDLPLITRSPSTFIKRWYIGGSRF